MSACDGCLLGAARVPLHTQTRLLTHTTHRSIGYLFIITISRTTSSKFYTNSTQTTQKLVQFQRDPATVTETFLRKFGLLYTHESAWTNDCTYIKYIYIYVQLHAHMASCAPTVGIFLPLRGSYRGLNRVLYIAWNVLVSNKMFVRNWSCIDCYCRKYAWWLRSVTTYMRLE